MKRWIRNCSGSMFVYVLVILIFLFTFSGVISEIYRVHSIRAHVEYEMQRAVNIAVEDAMIDSWRQDKFNYLDTRKAEENFMEYVGVWLGVNGALQKFSDGALIYTIDSASLAVTQDPPRMRVWGKVIIPSLYPTLATNMEVPFDVSSKNGRID